MTNDMKKRWDLDPSSHVQNKSSHCIISQKNAKNLKYYWASASLTLVKPLTTSIDLLFEKFSPHTEHQTSWYVPLIGSTITPVDVYKQMIPTAFGSRSLLVCQRGASSILSSLPLL